MFRRRGAEAEAATEALSPGCDQAVDGLVGCTFRPGQGLGLGLAGRRDGGPAGRTGQITDVIIMAEVFRSSERYSKIDLKRERGDNQDWKFDRWLLCESGGQVHCS